MALRSLFPLAIGVITTTRMVFHCLSTYLFLVMTQEETDQCQCRPTAQYNTIWLTKIGALSDHQQGRNKQE